MKLWGVGTGLLAVQVGGAFAGCSSDANPCEVAHDRVDSCEKEIREAVEKKSYASLPLTFSDSGECTGFARCVAECVQGASCNELAALATGGASVTDPNAPPVTSPRLKCVVECEKDS